MQGLPVEATFPADTLTTAGVGGCWVVAIVSRTAGMATHIPHGQAIVSPGGTVHQTITSNQQATFQMQQLMTAFQNNHIPSAMAYVLKCDLADVQSTTTIHHALTSAGLSIKTATYTYAVASMGNGNVAISCDGHSDPVMTLNGNKVIN